MKKNSSIYDQLNNYVFFDFVKATAAIPALVYFRPKFIYESSKAREKVRGGAIVTGKHYDFADPVRMMVAIWYRRLHFVCLDKFFTGKLRLLFKNFHCVPIEKGNPKLASIKNVCSLLKKGKMVAMFPEGGITEGEEFGKFKSGVIMMAAMGGVPVLPIYIPPRKNVLHRMKVIVGEPVNVAEICGRMPSVPQMEEVAQLLREKEEKLRILA